MQALLDRARSLSILGLAAGIFIGWIGWFASSVVCAMLFISNVHTDIWGGGQTPTFSVGRLIVGLMIQFVFLVVAGFAATMVSGRSDTDNGIALGVLWAFGTIFYVLQLMMSHSLTVNPAEIVAQWVLALGSVPATWFGAKKYIGS